MDRLLYGPYLLSSLNASAGADDDLVLFLHHDHLSDAVGSTGVVDVPVGHTKTRPIPR